MFKNGKLVTLDTEIKVSTAETERLVKITQGNDFDIYRCRQNKNLHKRTPSEDTFFTVPLKNTEEIDPLYHDLNKLIDQYDRSLQGCFCFFSNRKQAKITFLKALKDEYLHLNRDHPSLSSALAAIKDQYQHQWSTIIAGGRTSKQTQELIDKIEARKSHVEFKCD